MDDWQRREVESETRSRDINGWIQAANDELDPRQVKDDHICECSDEACKDPISLTRDEYERYTVVEKWFGEAARIALATNPRR